MDGWREMICFLSVSSGNDRCYYGMVGPVWKGKGKGREGKEGGKKGREGTRTVVYMGRLLVFL